MLTAIFIAALAAVLIWLGRSFVAGLKEGGYDEAKAEEARRDLEAARKQDEVLSAMRAANEQDGDFDDDPFRER